ncbi:hypothetical protein DSECCO2_614580 [anaerobic digester metagenome]
MADPAPHSPRLVGAVDGVEVARQPEGEIPQGVVRPRRHLGRQVGLLPADGLRHHPGRVGRLALDRVLSEFRQVPFPADADGRGEEEVVAPIGKEIVQAHLRQIDDDARVRTLPRRHEGQGQAHQAALARHPRVDAGVGGHDLVVAEAELPGDVQERVMLPRLDHAVHAVHARAGLHHEAAQGPRGAGREQDPDEDRCGDEQATGSFHVFSIPMSRAAGTGMRAGRASGSTGLAAARLRSRNFRFEPTTLSRHVLAPSIRLGRRCPGPGPPSFAAPLTPREFATAPAPRTCAPGR